MNLLQETIEELAAHGKTVQDVKWVGLGDLIRYIHWEEFQRLADFEYDNGYDGYEINLGLVVVGKDWWLERNGHDGSEWWEFKTMPKKPLIHGGNIKLRTLV